MGLGLQGAFGVGAMQQALRQRLIDQETAKQQQFSNDLVMRRQANDENESSMRRDEHSAMMQDRDAMRAQQGQAANVGMASSLADQIPAGTDIGLTDPAVPMMQQGGRGSLLEHADPNLASTEIGGMSALPGPQPMKQGMLRMAPQEAKPERFIKLPSEKQVATERDDARLQAGSEALALDRVEGRRLQGEATAQRAKDAADMREAVKSGRRSTDRKMWVMRDGQPSFVTQDDVRPGDRPASTREQGRPVQSSDANRMAELDTSLNDLDTLEHTLGTTGAGSKVGAMLPNVVSEMTGIGTESKQRQATIDRVKQVIGKALEGGVLRKEDEAKYEKILPTIGDPPEVAATKIRGLKSAIAQRRGTLIESLKNADFDTSKFPATHGPAAAAGPAPGASRRIVYDMNGNPVKE